jgi:hypothetical protein
VRELRNVIRRAILVASDVIELEHVLFRPMEATALAGETAPGASFLKEIAEAVVADAGAAEDLPGPPGAQEEQDRGSAPPPDRLQDRPPQDEALGIDAVQFNLGLLLFLAADFSGGRARHGRGAIALAGAPDFLASDLSQLRADHLSPWRAAAAISVASIIPY